MDGSIRLTAAERKMLLKAYRSGEDAQRSRRAHVILLLAEGASYDEVRQWLFASNDLISECARHFRHGGVAELLAGRAASGTIVPQWLVQIVRWLETKTPEDFGYFRTRWSCDILAEVLAWGNRYPLEWRNRTSRAEANGLSLATTTPRRWPHGSGL